jgi:hypothetical protein
VVIWAGVDSEMMSNRKKNIVFIGIFFLGQRINGINGFVQNIQKSIY